MNINLARKADVLLKIMSNKSKQAWDTTRIETIGIESGIPLNEVHLFISMFIQDEIFERIIHPSALEHDFGIYMLSHKGLKFIHFEGGYTEKQKIENYNKTNVKFTWIRHWLWFYTSLISLLANGYFILKYLAKWL